jgi:hypothetical protein
MNKTKILAFVAISAILVACGSDDGAPPHLKNSNIGIISPFDTIVAEFNSKIVDISKLNNENILPSQNMEHIIKQTSGYKLYFVGTDSAKCGFKHFKSSPNKEDSIVFLNIKNEEGYVQKRAVLKFRTYPMLDLENNRTNPEDLKKLGLGTIDDEVTFAGAVGINSLAEYANFHNYFKLSLKMLDSLYIRISDTKNNDVDLSLILPVVPPKDSIVTAKVDGKTKFIAYEMVPRDMDDSTHTKPTEFKIVVSSSNALTSYLLWVKVVEKK